jgi:hypothetical protein
MTKKCNKCQETKPLSEYFKSKESLDGHYSICKVCKQRATLAARANKKDEYNAYMKKYRKEHPDTEANKSRDRRKSLIRRYGITDVDYQNMLTRQGGKCALPSCGAVPVAGEHRFPVDHDHETGRVRGILCSSCNRSIAILDDSLLLKDAIEYVGLQGSLSKKIV